MRALGLDPWARWWAPASGLRAEQNRVERGSARHEVAEAHWLFSDNCVVKICKLHAAHRGTQARRAVGGSVRGAVRGSGRGSVGKGPS